MQTASAPFRQRPLPTTGTVLRKAEDSSAAAQAWEGTPRPAPVLPTLLPAVKGELDLSVPQGWAHFPGGPSLPQALPPAWDEGTALRQVLGKPE